MSDEKQKSSGSDGKSGGGSSSGKRKGRRRYFRRKRKSSGKKRADSNQNDSSSSSQGSKSNDKGNASASKENSSNQNRRRKRKRRSRRRKSSRRQNKSNTPQVPSVPENPNYVEPTDVYVHTHIVRPAYRDNLGEYRSEPLFHYAGSGSVLSGSAMTHLQGEINKQLDTWFAEISAPPKKVRMEDLDEEDERYKEYTQDYDEEVEN